MIVNEGAGSSSITSSSQLVAMTSLLSLGRSNQHTGYSVEEVCRCCLERIGLRPYGLLRRNDAAPTTIRTRSCATPWRGSAPSASRPTRDAGEVARLSGPHAGRLVSLF